MKSLTKWKKAQVIVILGAATAVAAHAQTFTPLAKFNGSNGGAPDGSLTQGTDGDLHGVGFYGGAGGGTVFRAAPLELTSVHVFDGQDGWDPYGSLALAANGHFYGVTQGGGPQSFGTVFGVDPEGGVRTLYAFGETDAGQEPIQGLILGSDGNLYGTTPSCFADCGYGTVFKITLGGALTTLHSFHGTDGAVPSGRLIEASDGRFYGTTSHGGRKNPDCISACGTIFSVTREGVEKTLYRFNFVDGYAPVGTLAQDPNGSFYGTTAGGGNVNANCSFGCGTVFKFDSTGALTTLYSFSGSDGAVPISGLIGATDGNFYGVTEFGGSGSCAEYYPLGCGTVFQVTPTGVLTVLYNFTTVGDGAYPYGGLFQATNGSLYGTTQSGGIVSPDCANVTCGTLFSMDMGLAPFVSFVTPAGKIGQTGGILGQGFTGTTNVTINGTPATFTVESDTFITATIPTGATSGYVTVTTPGGTLTSNVPFHVLN